MSASSFFPGSPPRRALIVGAMLGLQACSGSMPDAARGQEAAPAPDAASPSDAAPPADAAPAPDAAPGDSAPPPDDGTAGSEIPTAVRIIHVTNAAQLTAALAGNLADVTTVPAGASGPLQPGDHLVLADGTYGGTFTTSRAGDTDAAPIIVKAENLLGARFTGTFNVNHADVWLWGLRFDGQNATGTHVVLKGQRARLQRCRFERVDSPDAVGQDTSGAILVSVQGPDNKIYFSEFTDLDGRCISGKANGSTPMRAPHIYRCHFHDYRQALGNANAREAIQLGQTQIPDGEPVQETVGGLIEACLFQRWNTGGDDENETISIKSSGNTVRGSTFVDTNLLNIRFGDDNRIESNWFEGVASSEVMGIGVYGDRNLLIANHCAGTGPRILVNSGNQSMDVGHTGENAGNSYAWNQTQDNPFARDAKVISNECRLRVGNNTDTSDVEPHLPCQRTVVEDHRGTIDTQHDYPGSWDTPTAGLAESGTTYGATPTATAPAPIKLTPADVGPAAPWVAP